MKDINGPEGYELYGTGQKDMNEPSLYILNKK